jgi:ubiquinone/menaquinone biosynthesis C-methylase UbiE
MPTLFYTGKMAFPLRLMTTMSGIIAWITGNARDSSAMKEKMKDGYNGKFSDYIHQYDELSTFHYEKIANILLQEIDCKGKRVVDVGCGTGTLSFMVLEKAAKKISCVDISPLMLEKCKKKSIDNGYPDDVISFYEGDIEKLSFRDSSFDIVFCNMVLGMVPNQQEAISELARILRPGGTLALSIHGPDHLVEPIEALVKSMNKRYYFTHRFEYWPRDEKKVRMFLIKANLDKIQTKRLTWIDEFENGGKLFDFFASTSGLWWYHRLPPELRSNETEKVRTYFQKNNISKNTCDVIFSWGTKK